MSSIVIYKTVNLTPAVLRTLAEGIDRLNDGDDADRAAADEAEKALARAGVVVSNGQVYPAAETTSGYVKINGLDQGPNAPVGSYVFVTAKGEWCGPPNFLTAPRTLYLDEDCTVALRTIEDPNEYVREDDAAPQQS